MINIKQFKRDEKQNSNKLHLDKYYTSKELAKYCIDKVYEVIDKKNIKEIIEPSAGNGSFSNQIENCLAYDIEPDGSNIIKQDFLQLDLPYKKGRLIIGNPPFGEKMYMAQQFFRKSIELGDYIAFILPISQLHNTSSLCQFDLIHSEDLGTQQYSDRKLHCCFNIYRRPTNGKYNSRPNNKLKDVEIIRQDSSRYDSIKVFDLRMSYFGASAGRILKDDEDYCGVYKIIIHNKNIKDEILNCLENIDWCKELNFIAQPKIQQFHIVKVLKKYIKNIQ